MDEIKTGREFLTAVVSPDVAAFLSDRTSLRLAFHACISLLSLRDWIAEDFQDRPWQWKGSTLPLIDSHLSEKKRRIIVGNALNTASQIEAEEGWHGSMDIIWNVGNSAKHMKLTSAWKKIAGSANVHLMAVQSGAFDPNVFDASAFQVEIEAVVVHVGNEYLDLSIFVKRLHDVCVELFDENKW